MVTHHGVLDLMGKAAVVCIPVLESKTPESLDPVSTLGMRFVSTHLSTLFPARSASALARFQIHGTKLHLPVIEDKAFAVRVLMDVGHLTPDDDNAYAGPNDREIPTSVSPEPLHRWSILPDQNHVKGC